MLGNGAESVPALYGWASPTVIGNWVQVSLRDPSDRVELAREGEIWRMRVRQYPVRFHARGIPGRILTREDLTAHRALYAQATGKDALGFDWIGVSVSSMPFEPGDRLAVYRNGRLEDAASVLEHADR